MFLRSKEDTAHRFSDVTGEPCMMLAPIEGFTKKPLVTLELATQPLNNIVPRISTYVYIAKQRATNPANDLTVDESASIALYTMEWEPYTDSLYYILNATLRSEDRRKLKPWFLYLKLILTALSRLPSVSLTVYRGVQFSNDSEDRKYEIGKELVWWGFSSCSTNRNISQKEHFLGSIGRGTLFVIDCIKGKDIQLHSYFRKESEILLLPATKVQAIRYEYGEDDLCIIYLKEVESSFVLLEPVSSEKEIRALGFKSAVKPKFSLTKTNVAKPEIYPNTKLTEYIERFKPRTEVFLFGTHFTEHDVKIVVDQLVMDKQCRVLCLRESNISSDGARIISEALHDNNTLEELFISRNKIGDIGAKCLAEALSGDNNTTLKQLCLGCNGITDHGIEYIATMLESNQTLTHLRLPSNQISDRGLQVLSEVLINRNKTLKLLSLERNKFRSETSVNILGNMISNNQSLTSINLNNCKLPRSAIRQLKGLAKTKENYELLMS